MTASVLLIQIGDEECSTIHSILTIDPNFEGHWWFSGRILASQFCYIIVILPIKTLTVHTAKQSDNGVFHFPSYFSVNGWSGLSTFTFIPFKNLNSFEAYFLKHHSFDYAMGVENIFITFYL